MEAEAMKGNVPDLRPLAPDPWTFYRSLGQEDCYERLQLAIERQQGLAVVIGGAGYGKTTIKLALLQEIARDPAVAVGVVDDPRACRTDVQFLRAVLGQFGVDASGRTGLDLTTAFLHALDAMRQRRRLALLVIDQGEHLSGSQLEILRAFLSAETPARTPISIVIFAQPELEEKIARKRNLAQRVGMEHRLNPLNRRDTAGLIAHRLAPAGRPVNGTPRFTDEAIDIIYEHSGGIPLAITAIASACLAEAGSRRREQIDGALAAEVIGRRATRSDGSDRIAQIPLELRFGVVAPEATP